MSSIRRVPRLLFEKFKLITRNVMDDQRKPKEASELHNKMRKMAFNMSGYNKYGLYTHDVIRHDAPYVEAALRRLPNDVMDARIFRSIRAMHLNYKKLYLPEDKWITYEEDIAYRYLDPYIEEVRSEVMEIYNFGCVRYNYQLQNFH